MTSLRTLESRAIESYRMRPEDLAVARILYAVFVLVRVIPIGLWLPLAPKAFFYPPIGPAALFTQTPPAAVLLALNGLLTVFTAMLLVGWKTRLASIGTGLLLFALDAWVYSFGKINHDILFVITPLILAFADWGRALSVDARTCPPAEGSSPPAWPLALLALFVGFGLFTAGYQKAESGWLDPQLHCTYGWMANNHFYTGRETLVSTWALGFDSPMFWKAMDYATVAFELAFLPAAFNRRWFSWLLVIACFFHFGAMLLFAIPYSKNFLVYGAFVSYSQFPFLRHRNLARPLSTTIAAVAAGTALAMGASAILLQDTLSHAIGFPLDQTVVCAGVCIAAGYVLRQLLAVVRGRPAL